MQIYGVLHVHKLCVLQLWKMCNRHSQVPSEHLFEKSRTLWQHLMGVVVVVVVYRAKHRELRESWTKGQSVVEATQMIERKGSGDGRAEGGGPRGEGPRVRDHP